MAGMDLYGTMEDAEPRTLRKRILGLETLLELSRSLVSVREVERLDGLVLLTVMGLLSVSRAVLLTRDRENDSFHVFCRGIRDADVAGRLTLAPSGVFARRLKAAGGIASLRQEGLPKRESEVIAFLEQNRIHYAAPIRAKGELKGIALLGNRIDSKEITPFDAEMLQSILDLAGIVIDNVQLYEDLRNVNVTLADSNRRLKELDSLKNEFLSNVGHELRTPLTCITGFAQCLSYPDLPPDQLREFSQNIIQQSDKLSDLIDQILDLSEISDHPLTLKPEKGNLNDLIQEVTEQFRHDIEEKDLRFHMELNPVLPEIRFDVARTRRVLRNLLDNAIKFSKRRGRVVVSSAVEEEGVSISVTDDGIGIPVEDQESIFETFRQVDG